MILVRHSEVKKCAKLSTCHDNGSGGGIFYHGIHGKHGNRDGYGFLETTACHDEAAKRRRKPQTKMLRRRRFVISHCQLPIATPLGNLKSNALVIDRLPATIGELQLATTERLKCKVKA